MLGYITESRCYGVLPVVKPLGVVPAGGVLLEEGGTRMRPWVAGSAGGVAGVVGAGVARECRLAGFLLAVLGGGFGDVAGFGGVAGFEATGGCVFFAGVAAFLWLEDESPSDTRSTLAATLSTVTAAVTFSAVTAAGDRRTLAKRPRFSPSVERRLSSHPLAITVRATNGSPKRQPATEVTITGIATAGSRTAATSSGRAPARCGSGSIGAGSGSSYATVSGDASGMYSRSSTGSGSGSYSC